MADIDTAAPGAALLPLRAAWLGILGLPISFTAMTAGQLLVGQPSGGPIPRTISGNLELNEYGVANITGVDWSGIAGTPTTLAGYGITDSVPAARSITAGAQLTGGGDLSANRTIALATTGVALGSYGSATQVGTFTVNAYGQLTAASNATITPAWGSITGYPTLTGGTGINTIGDLSTNRTISLTDTGVAAGSYVNSNITVDAQGRITAASDGTPGGEGEGGGTVTSISTGTGLTGGPITTTGSLALADTAVTPASYGSATQVGTFTVDQQGRLTAAGNTTVTPAWGSITSTPTTLAGYGIADAVPAARTITAGAQLTGGGDLSANRTIALATTAVTAAAYGSASAVPTFTVNAYGQLTVAADVAIAIASGAVSGLAASATTDTTNAANISSGTLPSGRLTGSYTGITGVGTVTAGTWNATVVAGQYGGTGVANTGKTITLGGNLTTSGSFATTLTVGATTNVTLPASGTLVTDAVTTLSSLVSVGTITTGTWNAGIIAGTYGGTGINNGARTITIAGNLVTAGAFTTTLTVTATTGVTLPTAGTLATLAGSETFTNKTLTAPTINGGTHTALTALGIRSTGAAFDLTLASTEVFTAGRTLTVTLNDAARTLNLGGNLTTAAAFTTSGANALTLTTTGSTNVTLPTTGTLVNSAVTTLSSLVSVGTITTGTWNASVIVGTYGGTGVNNGASTITVGGNVTFSGAFATTVTVTGTTTVTLPTTGTLVNSAVTTLSSLVSVGTLTTGTWNASLIAGQYGGTGVANTGKTVTLGGNLTTSGAFATTLTVGATTNVTLPASGTLVADTVTTLSSLVSIGTITTGVWNATLIAGQYGGTGVNNSGKTITLGGNLTTSGAFATTLTATATTGVTLPTTGTLATLAGTETLSGKTLTAPTINGGTHTAITALGIRSTGAAFDLTLASTEVFTAGRTLTVKLNDAARTIDIAGNLTLAAAFITSGANSLTLTTTGSTNVTLPTTGTLVTSAVTTLSSLVSIGTITTGVWNGSIVAGTYGGTGVNNSTRTITIGGNLAFSGAFATTITVTGTTGVTLPTTGTLVNSAVTTLSSLVSIGTVTTGVWNASVIGGTYGGTGVNNGASTITLGGSLALSGAFGTTVTVTGTTAVTLPTTGTLVNSAVTTLSSLVSVGTITTGTWNATVVAGQYGGTGVANTGKTITLGGNFTTSGAFATTLTATGTTTVTLPTTGTLAVGANPTGTIGLTAVNGTATTSLRSDGAPALSQAIIPTWTGLHTYTTTAGGALFNGSAGYTVSGGVNGLISGGGDSLTQIAQVATTAHATLPETARQALMFSTHGSATPSASFKIADFVMTVGSAGSADIYGQIAIAHAAATFPTGNTAISGEDDLNVLNAHYGDTAGAPTAPYTFCRYMAVGGDKRATGILGVNLAAYGGAGAAVNRGIVFWGGTIRLNTIEDHTTNTTGSILAATGTKHKGILLTAATFDDNVWESTGCTIDKDGKLFALNVLGGLYTPTLTNTTNVAASTARECQYSRVGDIVTVSGEFDMDPTAAAFTQLGISLPVASDLATTAQVGGTGSAITTAEAGAINGDVANNRAVFNVTVTNTANHTFNFSFQYRII